VTTWRRFANLLDRTTYQFLTPRQRKKKSPISAWDINSMKAKGKGPRSAGRPWTLADDDMLRKLMGSGMKPPLIAQKMKRTIGAIQTRIFLFKKPRERQESGRPVEPGPEGEKMMASGDA
jgi:hypothetical protein